MEWLHLLAVFLFAMFGAACIAMVVVGLPGVWMLLGGAVVMELLDWTYRAGDSADVVTFGWLVLGLGVLAGLFGELLEFIAGAMGAKVGGGTKRGMAGAILGGFVGGIALTFVLPVVPVIGTLLGALIGTFIGAVLGEVSAEQAMPVWRSLRPATGATFGRVLGTVAKVGIAMVVWLVLLVAAIF